MPGQTPVPPTPTPPPVKKPVPPEDAPIKKRKPEEKGPAREKEGEDKQNKAPPQGKKAPQEGKKESPGESLADSLIRTVRNNLHFWKSVVIVLSKPITMPLQFAAKKIMGKSEKKALMSSMSPTSDNKGKIQKEKNTSAPPAPPKPKPPSSSKPRI